MVSAPRAALVSTARERLPKMPKIVFYVKLVRMRLGKSTLMSQTAWLAKRDTIRPTQVQSVAFAHLGHSPMTVAQNARTARRAITVPWQNQLGVSHALLPLTVQVWAIQSALHARGPR